jgi:hypothetical protein
MGTQGRIDQRLLFGLKRLNSWIYMDIVGIALRPGERNQAEDTS